MSGAGTTPSAIGLSRRWLVPDVLRLDPRNENGEFGRLDLVDVDFEKSRGVLPTPRPLTFLYGCPVSEKRGFMA
jgi:hypothetical protein